MYAAALSRASHLTFGRATAQFNELLVFLGIVSIALWVIVLVTILARFYAGHVRYRKQRPGREPGPFVT